MEPLNYNLLIDGAQWRIGKYLTVGLAGTVLDVGLFAVLRIVLGVPTLAANTTSYSAGIVNNYVLHRRWTYEGRSHKHVVVQFAQFAAISVSAMLLNDVLVLLLAPPFAAFTFLPIHGDLLAKGCATVVGFCLNYSANHLWTFRDATMTRAPRLR